ncbi:hypothetical protein DLM75_00220 [Leptospira stimsonii]|uniref:Uncharacterized protein n=1 Tax=Leptospira stimsonii TaxID=2202203 RepID=A0A396Z8H9_9LEPT|nr:hypothetical protein DLM75_00220 [Leptospira stimsonii]
MLYQKINILQEKVGNVGTPRKSRSGLPRLIPNRFSRLQGRVIGRGPRFFSVKLFSGKDPTETGLRNLFLRNFIPLQRPKPRKWNPNSPNPFFDSNEERQNL